MAKKSKTYRGQKAYREACKSPCGCFYCTGHSKADLQHKREIEADKEIINNVSLYNVSQQRELLKAFREHFNNNNHYDHCIYEADIEDFLDSL